jgi:hypothetical protein
MRHLDKNVANLQDEVFFTRFPVNFVNLVIILSAVAVAFLAALIMITLFIIVQL